jgi:hypothetical protein
MRGFPITSPWVRVPALKGIGMCGRCGRRGVKYLTDEYGLHGRSCRWCFDVDAPCQKAAPRCAGPFEQEHKVEKKIKEYIGKES